MYDLASLRQYLECMECLCTYVLSSFYSFSLYYSIGFSNAALKHVDSDMNINIVHQKFSSGWGVGAGFMQYYVTYYVHSGW
jgi:hypothetical protein